MICARNSRTRSRNGAQDRSEKSPSGGSGSGDLSPYRKICLQTPSRTGDAGNAGITDPATGVFLFRDRQELYERINQRVEMMFERGVIEEVRTAGEISQTASQMIGLREIRELLAGKKSIPQCIAEIQQATRRYAKRQLTWFRRQTNFSR